MEANLALAREIVICFQQKSTRITSLAQSLKNRNGVICLDCGAHMHVHVSVCVYTRAYIYTHAHSPTQRKQYTASSNSFER